MPIISLKSLFATGVALSFAVLTSHAEAAGPAHDKSDDGAPAPAATADYAVKLAGSSKWINVQDGDTVRFSANGKEFTWHFDTFEQFAIIRLADIAPAGLPVGAVKVYVAANPLYRN